MSIYFLLPYCENMNYYSKLVNALDNDELEYAEFKNSEMLTKIVEIENILDLAIGNRRLDVIEFCANNAKVKLHLDPKTGGLNSIGLANFLNFHESKEVIIRMYDFVNYTNPVGLFNLYRAAFEFGDDEVLRKLMDRNVNEYLCVGKFNCTPLYVAVDRTRYDIVELLLKKGADPNIGFEKGMLPPLRRALYYNLNKITELLLMNGADPNLVYRKDGTTSLHWICDIIAKSRMAPFDSYGLVELIELLIQYKADMNAKDGNGHSPMFRLFNQVEVIDNNSLLDLGADVNATDCNGNTPLQIAVSNAVPYLVKLFLDHEADARNIICEWKNFNLKRIRLDSFYLIQNVLDIIELIKNRIDYTDDSWDLAALDLFITLRNHYPIMDFNYAFTLGSTNDVVNCFTSQNSPPLIVPSYFHMVQIGQLYIDTEKYNIFSEKIKSFHNSDEFEWNNHYSYFKIPETIEWARSLLIDDNCSLLDLCRSNPDKIYPILINSNYRKIIGSENFKHYPLSCFVQGHFAKSFIDRYVKHKGVEFLLELTRGKLPTLCCRYVMKFLDIEDVLMGCKAIRDKI